MAEENFFFSFFRFLILKYEYKTKRNEPVAAKNGNKCVRYSPYSMVVTRKWVIGRK